MSYESWLNSIVNQINKYKKQEETDLVLLRNHLTMLVVDIEADNDFKLQLTKCKD